MSTDLDAAIARLRRLLQELVRTPEDLRRPEVLEISRQLDRLVLEAQRQMTASDEPQQPTRLQDLP